MHIAFTRVDNALRFSPAAPGLLDHLHYHRREFRRVQGRMATVFEKRDLYRMLPDGSVLTLPGFYPALVRLVADQGDTSATDDRRTAPPALDWAAVNGIRWEGIGSTGLRDYQMPAMAEFLTRAQQENGIVCATGGYGKTIVQAVTCAAFRGMNTILAIPLKEVFLQTHKKLQAMFPDWHIGRVGDGHRDISEQVTVTTFRSLPSCATEKCRLLLVDELQSATGDEFTRMMCSMSPVRVFGYSATDRGMFSKSERLVEGLFGERLIFVPYQEAERQEAVVPVTVWMVRVPKHRLFTANSMEARLRRGIQLHEDRNELVGRICQNVPAGWPVLVFVDKIKDHLVPLHARMPQGTRWLHRETSRRTLGAYALTAAQQAETIRDYQEGKFQFLLATDAFRAGVDVPHCRVVVQASGGTSEVELLQEAYRASRTLPAERAAELGLPPKTHAVLVDFLDQHDPALLNMSEARMRIYRKQGWLVREADGPAQIDWSLHQSSRT